MKKAQAAMEFLMTYGWAILVVIAAIAALAYFGVLDPSRLLPEKCEFPSGMDCVDKAAISVASNSVSIAMKNNIGFKATIVSVSQQTGTTGGTCGNPSDWNVTIAGVTYTDPADVNNNEGFTISLTCPNDLQSGKFSDTFVVVYRNNETGLQHNAVGVIRGKA